MNLAGVVVKLKKNLNLFCTDCHLLVDITPELHKDFVEVENGRPVLCVQVLKALHRMLQISFALSQKMGQGHSRARVCSESL